MSQSSPNDPRSAKYDQPISVTLTRRICAIRIRTDQTQKEHLGDLISIGPDCDVCVCGPGYNERTVRILFNDEPMYVFEEDLVPLSTDSVEFDPPSL